MAGEATGTKKQRDQLRAVLRDQGCTPEQIAAEMSRQFHFRARQAWRHTYGWTQGEVAAAYNRHLDHDQAPMAGKRISDYEAWPHGGKKPTISALVMLAKVYSTTVLNLIDLDDRQAFSTQELIILDAHNSSLPAAVAIVPQSPDMPPEHCIQNPTNPTPDATLPSTHRRWHLIPIVLLVLTVAISGAIIAGQTMTTGSRLTTPARTSTPSLPTASEPSVTLLPLPPLPSQTAPPQQPLIPLSPLTAAAPAPHQPSIPPPPSTRSDPLPPSSEPPTDKTASVPAATITWQNMYSGLCLDEQEEDDTHDTGTLRLWHCTGSTNQMWTENIIPAHPTSIAKNLVNSKSGKCVTYQPEPGYQISVWLAPCGKDGQGWIRGWNGQAYIFQAVEIPGICMSAPDRTTMEGVIGIQLRRCGPPSPLTDWLPYN